ncbi:MAG: PqqD family protein [Acidobacteriota bacterium]|nr:PqqD family protein [Acidobacteriota bacterium]
MISNNSLAPYEHVVFSELDEGEGVLVDLNGKRYYTLNETALFVWRLLEKRTPAREIVRELTEAYDVTPEQAASSVNKLIAELSHRNLLTPA